MNFIGRDPIDKLFFYAVGISLLIHLIIILGPWKLVRRNRVILYSPYHVKLVGRLPGPEGSRSYKKGLPGKTASKKNAKKMVKRVVPVRATKNKRVISLSSRRRKSRKMRIVSKKKAPVKGGKEDFSDLGAIIKEITKKKGKGTTGGGGGTGRGGGPSSSEVAGLQRIYFNSIISLIKEKWNLPAIYKKMKLTVIVDVTIAGDGKILKVKIEKASGNSLYDDAAVRTIKKIGKLPPPPFGSGIFTIGLIFNSWEFSQ